MLPQVDPGPPDTVDDDVRLALAEDLGAGDLSAGLLPPELHSQARLVSREDAVLCGVAWFDSVFRQLDAGIVTTWQVRDGDAISAGQVLCALRGPTRGLLSGERAALNFLQTLSGTATRVREYAALLDGSATTLLDTRKTIPGLRAAQKYAVRCGGGHNHRLGLFDGVLLKENHIAAFGSIAAAVETARARYPETVVEVEVEGLAALEQALAAGAGMILLDNFSLEQLRRAVAINRGRARLEASGGFDRRRLRDVAALGVDYVSVGALTKNVTAVDLSMRFVDGAAG